MSLVELPIRTDAGNYNFRTQLDGTDYIFRFRYNRRGEAWYMDLKDANNTPLVMGIKIVVNTELLSSFKHLSIPQGVLLAVNLDNQFQEPLETNFGTEIKLVYNEAA